MQIEQFVEWLRSRDRDELDRVVSALDAADLDTAGGAVARLRGGRDVARALRRLRRHQLGCEAAHAAVEAATWVCASTGLRADDRTAATRVARAAGDAARVLVSGVDTPDSHLLLRPFFGEVAVAALPAS